MNQFTWTKHTSKKFYILRDFYNHVQYVKFQFWIKSQQSRDKGMVSLYIDPLTTMSDQDRISPYNINTTSSRQVMRIKKNLN